MKFPAVGLLFLLASSSSSVTAFTVGIPHHRSTRAHHHHPCCRQPHSTMKLAASPVDSTLTPELKKMTDAFASIGDDKLRYKQLLYMANQLPPLEHPETTMIAANKVPGCLSTVYIDGTCTYDDDENKKDYVIHFVGDSDGLLTKGLVALLVRGLSGCTVQEIERVDPSFIAEAKISQSLTPGRNNGFLNMLAVMKRKARQLEQDARLLSGDNVDATSSVNGDDTVDDDDDDGTKKKNDTSDDATTRPMYNAMMEALQQLQPISLKLVDNSHQHAGHAGSKGFHGESHFELEIVSEAFQGLNLVKRHQLIYMILGHVMPKIHALGIKANTPSEVVVVPQQEE